MEKETRPANRTIKYVSGDTVEEGSGRAGSAKVDASLKPGARVKEQSAHYGLAVTALEIRLRGWRGDGENLAADGYLYGIEGNLPCRSGRCSCGTGGSGWTAA